MYLEFCHAKAWLTINSDCSGESGIVGIGRLSFEPPTEDDASLLGSLFLPECPSLGYDGVYRHLANAEHEAMHYRLCESLLGVVSPNHSILCTDVSDETTSLIWRRVEERLTTAVQYALNTGE